MTSELILLTGGAGFIGSHTAEALRDAGYRVRVLDSLESNVHPDGKPGLLPDDIELLHGDVTDPVALRQALRGVTYVFHFAAYQDYLPDFSKFIRVNAESTALLYQLIVGDRLPVGKVVVASSQAVYGEGAYRCEEHGQVYPPARVEEQLRAGEWDLRCAGCGRALDWCHTDESRTNPQNQYALSKAAQESIAMVLGARHGIPTVALRFSIVQGPRQSFWNAYSGACRVFSLACFFGRAPVVYEDGRQLRDYVNIQDVVAANRLVLERDDASGRVFNVGSGRSWSVLELAHATARAFGTDIAPEIPGIYRVGDSRHVISDISALRALGWSPRFGIEDSLAAYRDWLRQQAPVTDVRAAATRHMRQLDVLRQATAAR